MGFLSITNKLLLQSPLELQLANVFIDFGVLPDEFEDLLAAKELRIERRDSAGVQTEYLDALRRLSFRYYGWLQC